MTLPEDTRRAHVELANKLRSFVSRRVPPSDVEDVIQDVFLRVHGALPGLRDEERFAPWISTIARSAIADAHRRRSRGPVLDSDAGLESEPDRDGAEPSALEQELAMYMVSQVAELPSPYREALTLTELEGLTQRAAADLLGISLSGMKSRVQRGREKLRELIEECCSIRVDARGRVLECEPRRPGTCRCKDS